MHQLSNFLGNAVAVGLKCLQLLLDFTVLSVKINHFIYKRQLLIFKLLPNVLLDNIRIFPDEFNIQHLSISSRCLSQRS